MTQKMPKRAWGAGRGALLLIAVLLISSAMVRFGAGPGAAIALELVNSPNSGDRHSEETTVATVADVTPDLVALLEKNKAKEAELMRREAALEARSQTLDLVQTTVSQDLARLEKAEAKLRATMAAADSASEDDLTRLTAVYENMKAEQASELFQRMEPSFAAGFLGRMRSDAAAAILAGLDPDLAYSISVVMAGRNANVPRETVPEMPKTQDQ